MDEPERLRLATASFLAQNYKNKELIILDAGDAPARLSARRDPAIHYFYFHAPQAPLDELRNQACAHANGILISHWTDAWRAPDWLSHQVDTLNQTGAEACALSSILFFDRERRAAWKHEDSGGALSDAFVGSLCHHRSFWERNPFPKPATRFRNFANNGYWRGYVARLNSGSEPETGAGELRWMEIPAEEVESLEWFVSQWEEAARVRVFRQNQPVAAKHK